MILAVDTETTGTDFFHGCRAFLVTACDGDSNYYFEGSVNPYTREVFWEEDVLTSIQELLEKATTLVFHNTQFDMRALETIGINIEPLWDKVDDTLLASHLLASGDTHGLKELSIKYLSYWNDDEEEQEIAIKHARGIAQRNGWAIAKKGHHHFPGMQGAVSWWKQDMWLAPEETLRYALCDVERTWLLWDAFRYGLRDQALWGPYKLRKQLLRICYNITTIGQRLNLVRTKKHIEFLETKMELLRKDIEHELGIHYKFNWNKRDHIILLVHTHLGIKSSFSTPSGSPAVDKAALEAYHKIHSHPLLDKLMHGRKLETELRYGRTYLNWADDDGYIHSNLNITGTRETRQSSTAPNQQNITGKLKELFEPPPGKIWLDADFKNIELMLWAYAIGNEELINCFEQGQSVHYLIMEALYPIEAKAYKNNPDDENLARVYRNIKSGNFAIIYGATEKKSDQTYGFIGATALVYKRFPGVQEFTQRLIKECEDNMVNLGRFGVFTLGGYFLDVPSNEPFKACNYYIQGSAGIITTKAMIAISNNARYRDSESQMNGQVHDSIKTEIPIHTTLPKTIESIIHSMEHCALDIFRKTPVDYKIIYNKEDYDQLKEMGLVS